MAFQFVVETGVGDPDANSYVSVEFADDYIATNSFASPQWDLLDEDEKEKMLVRSSKIIDRRVKWQGDRVDGESGLRWPRAGVFDEDGFIIPDDVIPDLLKEAVCEFATYLMTTDWTNETTQASGALTKIKVDVIELEMDAKSSSSTLRSALPQFIIDMLAALGVVENKGGTAFKKIIRH